MLALGHDYFVALLVLDGAGQLFCPECVCVCV